MTPFPSRGLADLDVRRIAVLRALNLGDLLCAVPAFRALRAAYPDAEITLVGLPWARSFVDRYNLYFDDLIPFPGWPGLPERPLNARSVPSFLAEVQDRRFDLAIQMHGSGSFVNPLTALFGARRCAGYYTDQADRPDPELFMPFPAGEPEVRQHLRLMSFLGVPLQGEHLEFPIDEEDRRAFAGHYMSALQPGAYVCVHPGSQWPSRRWAPERFAAAADAFADAGLGVVLTGTENEKAATEAVRRRMRAPVLDLTGETTLGTLACLLEGARLLISNDTGPSHLAAALGVPSVVVASGSDVGRWAPLDRSRHRVLWADAACRPCGHAVCPEPGHPCAAGVTVDEVLAEAWSVMAAHPAQAREAKICAG